MQQTLVMLHGLTGSANSMSQFANKICPEGCNLYIPDAPFKHEKTGFCWWEYTADSRVKPQKIKITSKLLEEITHSMKYLVKNIPGEGNIILGGFSQGAVMAQIMMLSEISNRISGLVLLGTRAIEEKKLREALRKNKMIPTLWMHGKKDKIIDFDDSYELVKIFEDEGWNLKKIIHEKGHMIPLSEHEKIITFIQEIYSNNS
tara:strand:+ start:1017 stop:1625 length:609 start_codon:yes stop_codon:yes gene_type:complete